MSEFSDERSRGHESYVKRHTALDLMDTQSMIEELIRRDRLKVITARHTIDRSYHDQPGLLEAARARLAKDIGKHLLLNTMISFDEVYNIGTNQLHYSAVCLFIAPIPEERPI
jgi:hypothetical protein